MKSCLRIALLLLALPGAALAAKVNLSSAQHDMLEKTSFTVIQGRVEAIPQPKGTNGNPPELQVKVLETLRGEKVPFTATVVWAPMPYDPSWAGEDKEKILEEWKQQPVSAPALRSVWFMTGKLENDELHVTPIGRLPYSGDMFREVTTLVHASMQPRTQALDGDLIIYNEARRMRVEEWMQDMAKSDAKALMTASDIVALAVIADMQPDERKVSFSISQLIKDSPSTQSSEVITLMGLPDKLYGAVYDYNKLPDTSVAQPTYLLFLKTRKPTLENPAQFAGYAPTDPAYAIQPATPATLKKMGIVK